MRYRLRLAQAGHICILGVLGRAECRYAAKGAVLPRDSSVLLAVLPRMVLFYRTGREPFYRAEYRSSVDKPVLLYCSRCTQYCTADSTASWDL